EISSVCAETQLRCPCGPGLAEYLNDTRHRVRPVERALRTPHKFEPLCTGHGNDAEIECPAGIIHRNAIHTDLVVAGVAPADEEGCLCTTLPDRVDDGPGKEAYGL